MVTMTMRRTLARRWAFTGPDTSTTASSSAWVHGPVGVMATAGAVIALATVAAEAIAAAVAPWPIAAIMPVAVAADSMRAQPAEVTPQPCAPAHRALRQQAMAQPIVGPDAQARLMQLLHIAAAHRAAAVVHHAVVVADMLVVVVVVADMPVAAAEGTKLYC
jgi:hypothetical protein